MLSLNCRKPISTVFPELPLGCYYDKKKREGERACPFTTLSWDFLARHQARLARNPRMALQVKNLPRVPAGELAEVQTRAQALRAGQVAGC